MNSVTLQISLAPSDFRHSKYLLEHQLSVWAGQVDEVLITYDVHRSRGRFGHNWDEYDELMRKHIQHVTQIYPNTRFLEVDYSHRVIQKISRSFFRSGTIPFKDFRGGPFYSYFFGLYAASNNLVFHTDSDIFFGGGSQTWITEAKEVMRKNNQIVLCSPLPGPPRADKKLIGQAVEIRYPDVIQGYVFNSMSTRLFMLNRQTILTNKLRLRLASPRSIIKSLLEKNPPYQLPENIFSEYMQRTNLKRVDFLGSAPGMWSLHPPYRTIRFYDDLPRLIERIGKDDIPDDQRGFYDMRDSMCDWTEARSALRNNRWWQRIRFQ